MYFKYSNEEIEKIISVLNDIGINTQNADDSYKSLQDILSEISQKLMMKTQGE